MSAADMDLAPSPSTHPDNLCPHEHHDGKLVLATVFALVGVLGMFLLHALGTLRRRSIHKALHAVVSGAYMLSYPLVSYTLGIMTKSDYYFDEFPVWAVSLLMLLAGTDNLMACKLIDVESWKSFHVKHLYQAGLVVYIVAAYSHFAQEYRNPLWAILCVNLLQSFVRVKSMRMASKSQLLSKNVKPIADYMEHEKRLKLDSAERPKPNPVNMAGYGYVVGGEHELEKYLKQSKDVSKDRKKEGFKFTTVENIWQCKGRLLASERGLRLKDVCLSMALAKMLNRRFAGVKLAEADLEETKDFVFQGLIGEDKSYERVFRVIEVELGFVYDLYYTRYPYLYHKVRYLALCLPIAMVILCSWLTYILFKRHEEPHNSGNNPLITRTTLFLMAVVTFMEAFQLCLHMTSGWFKVALIRSYVNRPGVQRSNCFPHRIIGLLLRLEVLRPWANRLGQYSLLESYDKKHGITNFLHYVTLSLLDKGKAGRTRRKHVRLSTQVRKTVIDSLVRSKGQLTNGVMVPRNAQLTPACRAGEGRVTLTILVWHIATTICKHQLDEEDKIAALSVQDNTAVETASSLSQYCAYLVAFAPDLLPDHRFYSACELDKSIEEARNFPPLKDAKNIENKCEILMRLSNSDTNSDEAPLVVKGARLARQLMDIQDRWKVLSDFWAEMVLYIAPCDDAQARAHLEALAIGGEFITHLWALLTHAGVLQRDHLGPLAAV